MIVRKVLADNLDEALKIAQSAGCDKRAVLPLAKKAVRQTVIVEKIDNRAANILKQEAISCGADAAVSENVSRFRKGSSSAAVFATVRQLEILAKKLSLQPFGLKKLASELEKTVKDALAPQKKFKYKKSGLDLSKTAVMGIVNLDPASFSGDGLSDAASAAEQAAMFEEAGASIIDVGAESSRPGAKPLDAKTEMKRLIPAIKLIKKKVKIPVSADTYKYETAKAALAEGADIINDIFALRKGGEKLAKLIADTKAGVILMHMRGIPANMQKKPFYNNCTAEVFGFLKERKDFALSCGIKEDFISVDPGAGFGKTVENNIELIKNMSVFSSLGCVTAGVSRKRFVRAIAGEDTVSFVAASLVCACCGSDVVRVHDVAHTVKALKIIDAVRRA